MNHEEEITRIQQEIDELKRQFNQQYHAIRSLQDRLNKLTGKKELPVANLTNRWSLENFVGLRLIHFIGIIVLVIGLSIGVKYAIDRELISENLRILLAYLAGILLYLLSVRLRENYRGFSAILFSGAMASLYFTTYGANVYYNMFPFAIAFVLMALLTMYTSYEALRYNRQEIALLGLVGAYSIPFLISKNTDRPDLFFLYITIINCGVIFLVLKKSWKWVGMAAQGISWLLFIGWAALRMQWEDQFTALVFLLLYFLHFSFMLVYPVWQKGIRLSINDNYQVVMNNVALYLATLFVFGLKADLTEKSFAWTTLVIAGVVSAQALLASRFMRNEGYLARMLSMLALALFVMFIAFYWDGFSVTFLWLLTAVMVFGWGFYYKSVRARLAGILLIGITLGKLLLVDSLIFTTVQKVIAYLVLGVLLLIVSFFYQKFRKRIFDEAGGGSRES